MMDASLARAFRAISEAAPKDAQDWWIIGSAAMILAGVEDVEPADVDILGSSATMLRFLDRWGATPGEPRPGRRFRSFPYRRISLTGCVDIETMGDLEVLQNGIWRRVAPATRRKVEVEDVALFVPDIREQAGIMRLFGRPKDLAKAKLLEGPT